jgi:hypothetical protein
MMRRGEENKQIKEDFRVMNGERGNSKQNDIRPSSDKRRADDKHAQRSEWQNSNSRFF